jgi:hypothetical protein
MSHAAGLDPMKLMTHDSQLTTDSDIKGEALG